MSIENTITLPETVSFRMEVLDKLSLMGVDIVQMTNAILAEKGRAKMIDSKSEASLTWKKETKKSAAYFRVKDTFGTVRKADITIGLSFWYWATCIGKTLEFCETEFEIPVKFQDWLVKFQKEKA